MRHSKQVADKALAIARDRGLALDLGDVEAAAMLHDIGIFMTHAPGIECHGERPYLQHGILGAALLRREGMPEWVARVAERHTGAGITAEDIERQGLPLPAGDYCPETQLERLVCYADKFFSKSGDGGEKSWARVRSEMERFGPGSVARIDGMRDEFETRRKNAEHSG